MQLRIDPGTALPEAALAQMRALRARALPLQPTTDPAADAARFDGVVRRATHVVRLVDGSDLLAMGTLRREVRPLPAVELAGEYLVADPRLRGRPALLWAAWRAVIRVAPPARRGPTVLTAVAYPASVLLLGALGRVTLWGEPADPVEAALLADLRAAHADRWDPAGACVAMPTRPLPPTLRWRERAEKNPLYRRFVARCPAWHEGWGLPVAVRLDPFRATWGLLTEGSRRWWARRGDLPADPEPGPGPTGDGRCQTSSRSPSLSRRSLP